MSIEKRLTRERNNSYPQICSMRQAIPDQSSCKKCVHLGDLCNDAKRIYQRINLARVVVMCSDFEDVSNGK